MMSVAAIGTPAGHADARNTIVHGHKEVGGLPMNLLAGYTSSQ
jgi:hypothetical protein